MSRFIIAKSNNIDNSGLIGPDFTQLPNVGEGKENVVIDNETKNYWFSSDSATKVTIATIRIKHKQTPKIIK